MKRIAIITAFLLVIGCLQLYAQKAGMTPSPLQSQQVHPSESPAPYSEELACLPPDEGEMDMLMPEGEDMPQQDLEDVGMLPHSQGYDGAAMLPPMLVKLKLTDVQKKDVDKIVFDAAKEAIAQKAKVATARLELRQLFKADNPDKNEIVKKINEIAELSTQIHINRIDGWFAINKLLTPEQQKIWKHALAMHPQMGNGRHEGKFEGKGWQHPQFDRQHHQPEKGDAPVPPQQ